MYNQAIYLLSIFGFMHKNILQDVVADKRKRGFDIGRREEVLEELHNHNNRGFSKLIIWVIAIAAVSFLIFSFSIVLSGAVVKVTPRQESVSLSEIFTADKRTVDITEELPFDIMVISDESSKEVPATGIENVRRKSSGEITIYNSYSSKSQKLVKNTRFESADGKIYRIMKSVVVPGTTVSGGKIIPGSVDAIVYADEPGAEYNKDAARFSIPGLKGSPMFEAFKAESKIPISGGFSGEVKKVSDSDRKSAEIEIRKNLEETLLASVKEQKPEGFVLYGDGVFIDFEAIGDLVSSEEDTSGDTATISEKGTITAIIFDEAVLASYIARNIIENFDGSPVKITNIKDLNFNLLSKSSIDLNKDTKVSFRLSGDTVIVWVIDEESLREKFAGTPKKDFQKVMGQFLNIKRAEVTIRPFWKKSFPSSLKKIKIEILVSDN